MELLVKLEMLTSYIYGPTFGNAETVSFYLRPYTFLVNDQRDAKETIGETQTQMGG